MRRVGWSVAVVIGMGLLFALLFGGTTGSPLPLPIILVVGLGVVLLVRTRAVRTIEVGWSGARGGAAAAVMTPLADVPLRPASTPRAGGGSVARSLARVEAKE